MFSSLARCRIALAGLAAAAVLILTACSGQEKLQHGTVIDKRGHAAYTTAVYEKVFRQTNCRTVTPRPSRTTTRTRTRRNTRTRTRTTTRATTRPIPRQTCDLQYTGQRRTGTRHHPASWELKLRKDKRTGWKSVSKAVWDRTKIGGTI